MKKIHETLFTLGIKGLEATAPLTITSKLFSKSLLHTQFPSVLLIFYFSSSILGHKKTCRNCSTGDKYAMYGCKKSKGRKNINSETFHVLHICCSDKIRKAPHGAFSTFCNGYSQYKRYNIQLPQKSRLPKHSLIVSRHS